MKKQLLSEEFKRMQKLAGIITESSDLKLVSEETSKVYTIGDWFDKDNYDPNQKLGIHRAYNYNYGLILGFSKGNKGEDAVILAPQIVTRNGKEFPYKPKIYSALVSQITDVSKPGIEIKYDENKIKDNLKKLGPEGEKIQIKKTSMGYELPGLHSGNGEIVDIDVSNWIK